MVENSDKHHNPKPKHYNTVRIHITNHEASILINNSSRMQTVEFKLNILPTPFKANVSYNYFILHILNLRD